MPDGTYISKEEKAVPGFKAKDGLRLLLGDNADRGHRFNWYLLSYSENLHALKNISKVTLLVYHD